LLLTVLELLNPEEECILMIRNVSNYLPVYAASHLSRLVIFCNVMRISDLREHVYFNTTLEELFSPTTPPLWAKIQQSDIQNSKILNSYLQTKILWY